MLLPSLRFRLWEGSWPVSSTLSPAMDESVESTSPNELLDLVLELDAFLRVVAVIAVVEAELVGVVLLGVCAHPLRPRELLPDLHQYLGLRGVEGGVVAELPWRGTPPKPVVRASLLARPGGSMGVLMSRRGSVARPGFLWPLLDCGLTRISRLTLPRSLFVLHFEGLFRSGVSFSPSQ